MFGTLFSEINISRTDVSNNQVMYTRVPITYSQSEKMLLRVQSEPNADSATLGLTIPIMSFEMTTIAYDPERKLQTSGRAAYLNPGSASNLKYQYNSVPYNIGFQLNIWGKNVEDTTKIVEQILPYFTPDFTVTMDLIPELGVKSDIPVILDSISQKDPYETDLKKNQPIIWTFNFTVKANFWGPIKTAPIILFSNTNMRIPANGVDANAAIGVSGLAAWSSVIPGQDANGHPTSNVYISVPANTIFANSDFGYIEAYGQPDGDDGNIVIYRADVTKFTDDMTSITIDTFGPKH